MICLRSTQRFISDFRAHGEAHVRVALNGGLSLNSLSVRLGMQSLHVRIKYIQLMIRLSSSFARLDKHPRHFGRRRLIHPDQPDGHGPRPRLHENIRRSNQPSFERLLAAENQSVLVQSDSR